MLVSCCGLLLGGNRDRPRERQEWVRALDEQTKTDILCAGIAAPSADNSQPWRFVWSGDDLDLRIDADRSGRVSDTRYVLSDLAAGACLENMIVRARSLGYSADLQLFPKGEDELWVARIHWHRDPERDSPEPLAAVIDERHTDRRFPWRGPIPAEVQARLNAQAERIPGPRLWWPRTSHERNAALGVIRQAETLRFRSKALHAELFSSIRFSAGWHGTCEEGLAPATLAVEAPVRPIFQAMRRPGLMTMLNRLGAAPALGLRSAWLPIRLSPGLCLIVIPSTSRSDVFAGGRALERVWLQATLEGLSVQPYAAAGVLGLGFVPVEPTFRQPLSQLHEALASLCETGHGLVFLRLGHAKSEPRHRSGRRELASFGAFH
jgi:nitroreductase